MLNINTLPSLLSSSVLSVSRVKLTALGIIVLTAACSPVETVASEADGLESETAPAAVETTIEAILEAPVDGASVTLQGYVVRSGDDPTDFIFSDGTEEIPVEIYEEGFVADPETLVLITGEVDLEADDPADTEAEPEEVEIDISSIEVISP